MNYPKLDLEQSRKMDHLAVEHFGMKIEMMMEHAGRAIAVVAREKLGTLKGKKILVLAGKGNNGGDALVAGRFLHNWGAKVIALIAHRDITSLTKYHADNLKKLKIDVLFPGNTHELESIFKENDLIVDGLIGYNLIGNPRGAYSQLIKVANESGKRILAIDLPSGLVIDTGKATDPCIKADFTITLSLPKKGLFIRDGPEVSGKIYLADISIPREVFEIMGIKVPNIFEKKGILFVKR